MRYIVVTLLTLVALATTAAQARAGDLVGAGPGALLVDGDVVCGAIGDVTDDTDTALFSYDPATGDPIRPAEVRIGDEVLPGHLFGDDLLGVMELHYIASTFDDQTAPDPFCVQVEMEGADIVAVVPQRSTATACGRQMMYGMPIWLGIAEAVNEPRWSIALPGELTGYDETTAFEGPLNISVVWSVAGQALCAFGDAVSGEAYLAGIVDLTISSRTADEVTIAGLTAGADTFRLTSGSSVDAALVAGTTACVEVRGYAGVDGRVEMRIVDDPSCMSGRGGVTVLPDVAMEHAAQLRPEVTAIAGLLLVLAGTAAAARRRGPGVA
jgi:hypothetical protein